MFLVESGLVYPCGKKESGANAPNAPPYDRPCMKVDHNSVSMSCGNSTSDHPIISPTDLSETLHIVGHLLVNSILKVTSRFI